jgi:hypothetical protein
MMRFLVAAAALCGLSQQAAIQEQTLRSADATSASSPVASASGSPAASWPKADSNVLKFSEDGTFQLAIFSDLHFGESKPLRCLPILCLLSFVLFPLAMNGSSLRPEW